MIDQPPPLILPDHWAAKRPAIIRPEVDPQRYFPSQERQDAMLPGMAPMITGRRTLSSIITPLNITFDTSDGWAGYTIRQRIGSSLISGLGGVQTRVLFRGNRGSFVVNGAYVGRAAASGNAWNFASAPTALLVGGAASFTIPNGATSFATDWCNFTVTAGDDIIISVYCSSSAGDDLYGQNLSGYSAYWRNANVPGDIAPTSFTTAFYTAYSLLGVVQVY